MAAAIKNMLKQTAICDMPEYDKLEFLHHNSSDSVFCLKPPHPGYYLF